MEALIEKGARFNSHDIEFGILLDAVKKGHAVVKLLLDNDVGIDISAKQDALMKAIFDNELAVTALLLTKGTDVNAEFQWNIDGRPHETLTPLSLAARLGHIGMVKTLIVNGADPMKKNKAGNEPIKYARNPQIIEILKAVNAKK